MQHRSRADVAGRKLLSAWQHVVFTGQANDTALCGVCQSGGESCMGQFNHLSPETSPRGQVSERAEEVGRAEGVEKRLRDGSSVRLHYNPLTR
ncbi:unnamed protein product [Protopolystoma xenopodis]|uniref:Uncharacterized protein n=1 Tax=Protopolystoma xenopodis TaxID=117903 RepID=A0A3S5ABP6_9PLAT|nr:unnamed protein product [Protopolystoma xenopodis]